MKKWEQFTKEQLEEIIKSSFSYAEVLKKIGYKSRSNIKTVKEISSKYNIDISHFKGSGNRTYIPMIGKQFGRLKVLELDNEYKDKNNIKDRNYYYKCECQCENKTIVTVSGRNLRSGSTKSCGCLIKDKNKNNIIPMIGKKFGHLTVLEENNDYREIKQIKSSSYFYKCRCDCGNIITVNGSDLRRKGRGQISCGCILSKGEEKIKKILNLLKINFVQQYIFQDLKSNKGYNLKFDFAIFDENKKIVCLIEFQGKQHYEIIPQWRDENKFISQQENDNLKRQYCKQNNIPLIEIPYWDFDKIDELYIKERLDECSN